MSKATSQQMGDLHGLTAAVLSEQIQQMKRGEIPLDTKVLAAAIKFLKDNNIECTDDDMKKLFDIKEPLPTFVSDLMDG